MAIICWGNLAKSADETTRIEQSIEAYVEAHDENVNAHQIEGSALYMHRVLTELDHPDGSISLSKILSTADLLWTAFESFDSWEVTADYFEVGLLGSYIQTSGSPGNVATAIAISRGFTETLTFLKDFMFQTAIQFGNKTYQTAYIVAGSYLNDGTDSSFGFKVVNGTIYACHISGNGEDEQEEYSTEIGDIAILTLYTLRAKFFYTEQKIEFYINGELVATHDFNLPSVGNVTLFTYYIKTATTSSRNIQFNYLLFQGTTPS